MSCGCPGCREYHVDKELERLDARVRDLEAVLWNLDASERISALEKRLEEAVRHIRVLEGLPEEPKNDTDEEEVVPDEI